MKLYCTTIIVFFVLAISGCELPQVIRPLRLYDLGDGKTIEVFLRGSSPNSGKLVSGREGEKFEGEFVLYGGSAGNYRRPIDIETFKRGKSNEATGKLSDDAGLAELYGFGKDTNARPVGTAILVGDQGMTIEIVFYNISADLQYGDGVAKDNKGRSYRVFLSVEK